jgi:hypothetical protein
MSTAIFNRADFEHPADGWYQIEPKGIHHNREAGVDQVIDDPACSAIVNRFNADADAGKLPQGSELLIDHEHFKDQHDQETIAYGWLQRLQSRADGIYGKIRWTAVGQAAVDGGSYRFFSSEYVPEDLVALGGSPPRIRPIRLDGLTLTNMPNNRGGKPITNRAGVGQNRLPEASNPRAAQDRAAKLIARLADEAQRSFGGSPGACFRRVMNREKSLCSIAQGGPASTGATTGAREVIDDPAAWAARKILCLAQARKGPGLHANLTYIKNRRPRLVRIANREGVWDCLADLEPVARAAFDDAVDGARDSMPEPRLGAFLLLVDTLVTEFPDLGYEGLWEKIKEVYPATFLQFILSFEEQAGASDMTGPAPKTEQERSQEKRARINIAASDEWRARGINPPNPARLTVDEALRAL